VKALDLPHCILGDEGGFRGEFFPVIKHDMKESLRIERHTPSALRTAAFLTWIEQQRADGRDKVVLGGISVDNCAMQTSLDLLAMNVSVYIVVDVSGAESALVEWAALQRLIQAGATPINWTQLACEVLDDWQTPEGPEIVRILATYSR
jgi:nicotinamidase-related amidase